MCGSKLTEEQLKKKEGKLIKLSIVVPEQNISCNS